MKSKSPYQARKQERGNVLYRRFYDQDYLPGWGISEKYWSGKKKLEEFLRRKLIRKKGKGYSDTHHGFFFWLLSHGPPKSWDELNSEQQKRWTNKIIEHVIARHRERMPDIRMVLRDPMLTRIETGKPTRFALSVDQEVENLSEMVYDVMQGLSYQAQRMNLSPKHKKIYQQKFERIANLFTIYANIHGKLLDKEITFE